MNERAKNQQLEMSFNSRPDSATGAAKSTTGGGSPNETTASACGISHSPSTDPLIRMMDGNFLQYASYVIRERAIPEISDGLKPVQRRIMHALHDKDDGKFIKVANIVGHTMQYHPHGDASIADALVALVNKRYLIEGQGNFGNPHTGDSAAAPRYIECRLTELARREIFNDDLTVFIPTYDGRNREPVSLPSKIPLLLLLGAEGIAVGLSTRLLPHNFGELLAAQIAILRGKSFAVLPDFQQGGIMDVSEYDNGFGRVRIRAVIETRDAQTLVIRELPYGTTTETLIASIEDAARKGKLKIRSIQDYTAGSVEIAIKTASGEAAEKTIKALYAFTACEHAVTGNGIVISRRRPQEMGVSEILRANTDQLTTLLRRELELARDRLLEKLHAKTLERIFIENRIYKKIESCKTQEAMMNAVSKGVNAHRAQLRRDVTEADIERLLELHIRRISRYDIERNREETAKLLKALGETEKKLKRLTAYAIAYLKSLQKEYAADFPRRTHVEKFDAVNTRELTKNELTINHDRDGGYLGWNVRGEAGIHCSSFDKLLLAWSDGRYKMIAPPEKLFVDKNLIYCARFDRDRIMTAVYRSGKTTYVKRFTFGGAILNRDYSYTPAEARVLLLCDNDPEKIYAVYQPSKKQRIHQQIFSPRSIPVKSVKARGNQMTLKTIRNVSANQPRNWNPNDNSPPGRLLK